MYIKTRLRDVAALLDDLLADCGLPEENWSQTVEDITEIEQADLALRNMLIRLNEVFEPLPEWMVIVDMINPITKAFLPVPVRVKGKDPKMAIRWAMIGLDEERIQYEQVRYIAP